MKLSKSARSLLKKHPHVKEVASGRIALAAGEDKALIKKALFCRTGSFDGMYGPVDVTVDLLQRIADRYNATKKNAQNEHDFAPILTDHIREVDRIKGRVPGDMYLEKWVNPDGGQEETGLFGSLRIDDEDAQKKVEKGLYAHLSISFDEETAEFFEISFVAVEAARGSMVLAHKKSLGGTMAKKQAKTAARGNALASVVKAHRKTRLAGLSKIAKASKEIQKEITELCKQAADVQLSAREGQVKGRFSAFVRQGKMNPAELAKVDFKSLAKLPKEAYELVTKGYEDRSPSSDMFTFGQENSVLSAGDGPKTKEAMKEAIKLQQAQGPKGKAKKLAAEDDSKDKNKEANGQAAAGADTESFALGKEDWEKMQGAIDALNSKLGECVEKLKSLGEDTDALSEADKEDEKKELAAGDEDTSDLAGDDDEGDKDKNKDKEGAE